METARIPKIVVLLDASRGYEREVLRGIWQYANLKGPWTFLRRAPYYQRGLGLKDDSLAELRRVQADAIITHFRPHLQRVGELGLPTVVVPAMEILPSDETMPGMVHLLNDDDTIGAMAAEHLREMGLRHFAYAGFDRLLWSLGRKEGFCRRLAALGCQAESRLLPFAAARRAMARHAGSLVEWLSAMPKPLGLFVCNDEFALLVSELCRVHGIRVPEEVAIVGVDNDEVLCELGNPPLSSIAIAAQRAGFEAAAILDRMMRGEASASAVTALPIHVVRRQSTDVAAIDDAAVAKAVQFIRQNAYRVVQVDDAARAASLSRRSLSDRMMRSLGHSITDEISARRVETIARLLTTTNRSVSEIAAELGYTSDKHIARFFRRQTGVTPRAYRRRFGQI